MNRAYSGPLECIVMRKEVHYEERICDYCGKSERHDKISRYAGTFHRPFVKWVDLINGPKYGKFDTGERDFCSPDCMVSFFVERSVKKAVSGFSPEHEEELSNTDLDT